MSTKRRTLGVYSQERPLGPNGEKSCYNCGGPLPKGRPYNCSSACSEEWQCKTSPSYLRQVIFQRDHGVCALCGTDTAALRKQYRGLPHKDRADFASAHAIPAGRRGSQWWDADHIVSVVEGGGECGLDNYRTLCLPCHRKVTRELHARLAGARKKQKATVKDQERGLLQGL